jgi:hypothetical protein
MAFQVRTDLSDGYSATRPMPAGQSSQSEAASRPFRTHSFLTCVQFVKLAL